MTSLLGVCKESFSELAVFLQCKIFAHLDLILKKKFEKITVLSTNKFRYQRLQYSVVNRKILILNWACTRIVENENIVWFGFVFETALAFSLRLVVERVYGLRNNSLSNKTWLNFYNFVCCRFNFLRSHNPCFYSNVKKSKITCGSYENVDRRTQLLSEYKTNDHCNRFENITESTQVENALMLSSMTSMMRQFYIKHRKIWWLFDFTSIFIHLSMFFHIEAN